jgi:hypothetical protein
LEEEGKTPLKIFCDFDFPFVKVFGGAFIPFCVTSNLLCVASHSVR